ncbi:MULTISPECIES: RlpA-like double-psi beta-barrel domain-containing protein [Streptomyces]|uniref:RlpA-like double-psi beta-barrel domain-containing protein n=1 Tax=Streptomyces TaxID=1883 RepID=UPI000F6BDAB3|nr:RlpA-like double-psi beta-barrel domain-containing protein [Streptomyces sp. W1SF4]AZM87128.1 hypothetical protein D1J60_00200 [Streptomyces sp. W1SF4]
MKTTIATAAVAVAVLAAGSGAVITVATASASETGDVAVSAQAATVAAKPEATVAAQPNATVVAEPAGSTLAPPAGGTTAQQPSKTPAPSGSPQPDTTTAPPPKPSKTATASPQPDQPGETYKGSATHYSPGLGACGKMIKESDLAVALDPTMFGAAYPSSTCGRKVVITYKGKSITATVLDKAPGAGRHGLDLTPGAFKALASLDKRKLDVTWRFAK